ncbi:hypothetical protein PGTUg99_031638 [Puccinia graminis f. sp. tritici]|uniref:Uncharacterized protein n=1 Tax=Puccinia graminis f. sp. tritici TaxID=56615 RepID=A0A5B0LV44_PUCGR|nr:hypothetical protein PGTUg99_031638 [Puccinia graminis f. sp. tritici]
MPITRPQVRVPVITPQEQVLMMNTGEMGLQGQWEEMGGEPYIVMIQSPGVLDSFLSTLVWLFEVLKQQISHVGRPSWRPTWEGKRVSSEFESKVDQIQRILLPSNIPEKLQRLCGLVSDSIDHQILQAPRLLDGIKALEELRSAVVQLSSLANSFWVSHRYELLEADREGAHERLKRYRAERAHSKLTDLFFNLNELLLLYVGVLPLPEHRTISRHEARLEFADLIERIRLTETCRDRLTKWFDLSELSLAREHWQEMAEELDELLEESLEFPSLHKEIYTQPLREFTPILKLSRLFFNKISRPTSDESLPISEMKTAQLLNLINLTVSIPTKLTQFYDRMECEYEPHHPINLKKVSNLGKLFQAPLNLLTNHLSDQAANTNSAQDSHAQFHEWYADWQDHFSLAVRRFHSAYRDVYSDFLIPNQS